MGARVHVRALGTDRARSRVHVRRRRHRLGARAAVRLSRGPGARRRRRGPRLIHRHQVQLT